MLSSSFPNAGNFFQQQYLELKLTSFMSEFLLDIGDTISPHYQPLKLLRYHKMDKHTILNPKFSIAKLDYTN